MLLTGDKFQNRKILLFSPQFFDYGNAISDKLRQLGAQIDIFDERPGNDFFTKGLIRINKHLLARKTEAYYFNVLEEIKPNFYDYVLFLNPEAISVRMLEQLRKHQGSAQFILYMWDSIKNKKHTLKLLPYFHSKFTFDKQDSAINELGLKFRPLFFLDEYARIKDQNMVPDLDLFFVGTIHSDRFRILMHIREKYESFGLKTEFFMYLPNKKLFYLNKMINRDYSNAKLRDFEYTSMPREVLIDKVKRSRVILDIQHPSQEGLTMRTIEMIGAGKKLLTTNREVVHYDFYDSNNIQYIERNNPIIDKSFFETVYRNIDSSIYERYSIQGWLHEVFIPNS